MHLFAKVFSPQPCLMNGARTGAMQHLPKKGKCYIGRKSLKGKNNTTIRPINDRLQNGKILPQFGFIDEKNGRGELFNVNIEVLYT
jgi:hypothetical protein